MNHDECTLVYVSKAVNLNNSSLCFDWMLTTRQSRGRSGRRFLANVESRAQERFHGCLLQRRLK